MPILWIDIETLPGSRKPDPSEIQAPSNYKDPVKIAAYQEENADSEWRKQALESLRGRLCCIGWAVGNEPPKCRGIWEKSETELLAELDYVAQEIAADTGVVTWGGFNLRQFDLHWIWQRAVKHNLATLKDFIQRDRYPKNVLDVRDLWTGGDSNGKGKLKDIAAFFGLDIIEGMDGMMVFDLFQAEEFEKISTYCRHDVTLTRAIAHRMGYGNPMTIAETKDPFTPSKKKRKRKETPHALHPNP